MDVALERFVFTSGFAEENDPDALRKVLGDLLRSEGWKQMLDVAVRAYARLCELRPSTEEPRIEYALCKAHAESNDINIQVGRTLFHTVHPRITMGMFYNFFRIYD
jgi:hypothetical protein